MAAPPAAQPALPESIPQTASINPIAPPPPAAGTAPPPPPPISDKAATAATPTTSGLRLTFAPGQSDLSPESSSSIKQLTTAAPAGDATTFNVLAYAPGKPDDPSTARRVSLSRAMAVRSALVADGVPSARIFVPCLGPAIRRRTTGPVDLSVTGAARPPTRRPRDDSPIRLPRPHAGVPGGGRRRCRAAVTRPDHRIQQQPAAEQPDPADPGAGGSAGNLNQVLRLRPEVVWLETYQTSRSRLAALPSPKLLAPMASMLAIREGRVTTAKHVISPSSTGAMRSPAGRAGLAPG